MEIIHELAALLQELLSLQRDYKKRAISLSDYANKNLASKTDPRSGAQYYYAYDKGSRHRKYLGSGSNLDVQYIRELHFINKALEIIESNISLIESFIHRYRPYDLASINPLLGKTYQTLDSIPGIPETIDLAQWRSEKEREKASFPVYKPEYLRHRTIDGTMTRTKSEAILLNYYCQNGIPCVYELPRIVNGARMNTDFTILSLFDLEEKYHEHEGCMFDKDYQEKHLWRLTNYISGGYTPNVNLFFTYEDFSGNFDMRSIENITRSNFKRPYYLYTSDLERK